MDKKPLLLLVVLWIERWHAASYAAHTMSFFKIYLVGMSRALE